MRPSPNHVENHDLPKKIQMQFEMKVIILVLFIPYAMALLHIQDFPKLQLLNEVEI
jgi:hypothetical protein